MAASTADLAHPTAARAPSSVASTTIGVHLLPHSFRGGQVALASEPPGCLDAGSARSEISLTNHASGSPTISRMSHDPAETTIAAGGGPGDDLYRIVCDYASIGHHRSGTGHGRATAEWFTDLVRDLGTVTETAVNFERYNVASELIADGRCVDHLALYYEFTGEIDTTDVAVRRFDPRSGGFPRIADELIRETKRAGHEALVIATEHPSGELVAINRDLGAPASGLPTLLVAGRHYDALDAGTLRVRVSARLAPGHTTNIEVSNDRPGRRLVLTTPLNAWFAAAGERGYRYRGAAPCCRATG